MPDQKEDPDHDFNFRGQESAVYIESHQHSSDLFDSMRFIGRNVSKPINQGESDLRLVSLGNFDDIQIDESNF